jgi:membrane protein involved in colicin uptake
MALSHQEGYTDLTLKFQDKACTISLQIAADGRVGDFTPFSCE